MSSLATSITFTSPWILWIHNVYEESWTLDSYYKFNIVTAEDFWGLMNNFDSLNFVDNYFIFTKYGENPSWESNKNGCNIISSIKLSDLCQENNKEFDMIVLSKIKAIWINICLNIISDKYIDYGVYGITFSFKLDMFSIKVMLKNYAKETAMKSVLFSDFKDRKWRTLENNKRV